MKVSLKPQLTATDKANLHRWLKSVMSNSRLESHDVSFPLGGKIVIYVNGKPCWLHGGQWQLSDNMMYVGQALANVNGRHPVSGSQRLSVIAQLITVLDAWEEYMTPFAAVISKAMLESYNELKSSMQGLVNSQVPATGLAFNQSAGLLAAKMDDKWYAPNGEETTVEGDEWIEAA